jgi:hypothetical protein
MQSLRELKLVNSILSGEEQFGREYYLLVERDAIDDPHSPSQSEDTTTHSH